MTKKDKNNINTEETVDTEKTVDEAVKEETTETEEALSEDKKEIEKLKAEIASLNDKYLRLASEYDNFRKRSQKEKDAIYPDAVASTVEKFLPLSDNFERAMSFECKDEEFKKGMVMIENSLKDIFTALSVEAIGEIGEKFDPNFHNAVMHEESEELGENEISAVFQKGFKIGDKVIRCAMVKVAN